MGLHGLGMDYPIDMIGRWPKGLMSLHGLGMDYPIGLDIR